LGIAAAYFSLLLKFPVLIFSLNGGKPFPPPFFYIFFPFLIPLSNRYTPPAYPPYDLVCSLIGGPPHDSAILRFFRFLCFMRFRLPFLSVSFEKAGEVFKPIRLPVLMKSEATPLRRGGFVS